MDQTRAASRPLAARWGGRAAAAALLVGGIAAPIAALAAETSPEVVVTATRVATPLEEIGQSVSVITREEIEEQQYKTVTEALRTVPGLRIVQLGNRGSVSSLFMRGANANQTLILLNGERVSDPGSPSGAFNFAHVPLHNVERIEVVRGAQSALFGSDAIAGVVNIITRQPEGDGVRGSVFAEGGTFGTAETSGNLNGRVGKVGFDVTVSGVASEGDTITPARLRPAGVAKEDDAYRNLSGTARLNVDLTDNLDLSLFGQATDTFAELDTAPEDPNAEEETRQYFGSATLGADFWEGRFRSEMTVSYTKFVRDDENDLDTVDPFLSTQDTRNAGERIFAGLENRIDVTPDHTLVVGGELYEESFESTGVSTFFGGFSTIAQNSDADAYTAAAYVQDIFTITERLSGTASLRYDKPEDLDGKLTWHLAPTYRIAEIGTRLKASVGTGFKTPSLFQRFGFNPSSFGPFIGNPNLKPEESFSWDVGFEQELFDGRLNFGSTYFQSDIDDGVVTTFGPTGSTSVNNADIETYGVESFIEVVPYDPLTVRVDYTFLRADNENTGQQLLRRPKHKVSADATWRFGQRASLGLGMVFLSGINDVSTTTFQTIRLPSYAVFRAFGSYQLTDDFELTAHIENLTDRDYETADGFKGPGLEAFIGGRLTF